VRRVRAAEIMTMAAFELEPLLAPLTEAAPCGPDLEYDPAFLAMQATGEGKPERQYGDTLIAAEAPDWPQLHEQAAQVALRTRDLRVAVWLARSGARVAGLGAAVQGLQLVQGLLERYWDSVHPLLDAGDNNDPTARLSAVATLTHLDGGLADLRSAGLSAARGSLTVRAIELAIGRAEPLTGESVPSEDGVLEGVRAALAQQPALAEVLGQGEQAVRAIAAVLDGHLGAGAAPDFSPLLKLMQALARAGRRAGGTADAQDEAAGSSASAEPAPRRSGAPGTIASREDAISALERVCDWIERNEPSNPAPLLIRRAQRLMSKNFLDIIRDLMPEGLDSVEKLAGPGGI
jgi:type VI secretion system protein ImpA